MIVDCHCHVGAGEVLTGPWDVARLDRYLRRADQAGIGRTVLFATFHGYRPLVPDGPRIDWILTRGDIAIHAAAINTYARNSQFPSDHLPVQALITIANRA